MTKNKRIVLLDMHAILHRAYHALVTFKTSKGFPTGALYGLCLMLMRITEELAPDYIIACYDLPKKTFRHESYAGYKGGRKKTDDELVTQIIESRKIIQGFGIPIYECEGFEADDLLGTIAHDKGMKKYDIVIASGDMDTMQLVEGERVSVFTLKKGLEDTILYNEEKVKEKMGFDPKFIPDYKGLRGDPSDNIIGVPGIGDKTATILIQNFGTVENIYKQLKKKDFDFKKIKLTERIIKILLENEEEALFSKVLATIRLDTPVEVKVPDHNFAEGLKIDELKNLFTEYEFRTMADRVTGLINKKYGVSKVSVVIPNNNEALDEQNRKELSIALWLLNPEKSSFTDEDILAYSKEGKVEGAKAEIEKLINEAHLDFVYSQIEKPLVPIVDQMILNGIKIDKKKLKNLEDEYSGYVEKLKIEIWALAGEEFNISSPKQMSEILFEKLKIQDAIKGLKIKKTATGQISTREEELLKFAGESKIVDLILEYRELSKLLNTYISVLPTFADDVDRIHSKFNQAGTTTGRFSSDSPNLQNLPIRSERGEAIRECFIAEDGYSLLSLDYSQVELRIAALLAQDEFMISAFDRGEDIHKSVAMKIFDVKENEVTSNMRRQAKTINFGILYGMGVNALAKDMKVDRDEAQKFYNAYFENFPKIKNYFDKSLQRARDFGYTETLFGRRRFFPLMKSFMPNLRAQAERMAMNAPIQGTATADIIKLAIISIDDFINKEKLGKDVRLVLQVHDELVYEVKDKLVQKFAEDIKSIMEKVIPADFVKGMSVPPLVVEYNVSKNWKK